MKANMMQTLNLLKTVKKPNILLINSIACNYQKKQPKFTAYLFNICFNLLNKINSTFIEQPARSAGYSSNSCSHNSPSSLIEITIK